MKFSLRFLKLILILWMYVSCHYRKSAVLTSVIKNYEDESIWLYSDRIFIEPETIKVMNDSFYKEIQMTNSGFMIISIGSYQSTIFMKPGYSLKIYCDGTNIDSTIKYEGKGSLENAIQDSIDNNVLYAVNYNYIFEQAPEPALKYVDSLIGAVYDYAAKLTKNIAVDKEYKEYLEVFLKYYFANLKIIIGLRNEIKEDSYYAFIDSIFIEDTKLLDVPEYRDFLTHYVTLKKRQSDFIDDSLKVKSATSNMDKRISIIASFKNRAIKEYLVYNELYGWLQNHGVKDFDKYYDYFKKNNKNKAYASQIEKAYLKKKPLAPGNYAPDFTCYDFDSNKVSLSDFKGKYVYLDFWATWCKPCRKEIPHYVKLHKEYKDKDIVFLSISLNEKWEYWQEFIKDIKDEGKWLFAGNGFNSDVARLYQIRGIPKFCLIDKEGKILDINAPRPSSDAVRKLLDSLLSTK